MDIDGLSELDPNRDQKQNDTWSTPSNKSKGLNIYHPNKGNVEPSKIRGDMNLLRYYNEQKLYSKYCEKTIKEPLSSFLPDMMGLFDKPSPMPLQSIIQNSIVTPIISLTPDQLNAFRLAPEALPKNIRDKLMVEQDMESPSVKQKKMKKKQAREILKQLHENQQVSVTNDRLFAEQQKMISSQNGQMIFQQQGQNQHIGQGSGPRPGSGHSKTPDPSSMSRGLYQNQQDQNWLTQNQNQSYPQNVLNPPGPHQQKVQIQGYPAQNTQGRNNWAQSSNNHSGNSSGRQSAPIPGTGIYNDGGFGRESPVLDSGGNPVRKKKRKKDKSHK